MANKSAKPALCDVSEMALSSHNPFSSGYGGSVKIFRADPDRSESKMFERACKSSNWNSFGAAISRLLAVATIALAVSMIVPALAAAAPPGHPVRVGVLDLIAPSFDPATN